MPTVTQSEERGIARPYTTIRVYKSTVAAIVKAQANAVLLTGEQPFYADIVERAIDEYLKLQKQEGAKSARK